MSVPSPPEILVLRHEEADQPQSLTDLLDQAYQPWRYVDLFAGEWPDRTEQAAALLILGGSMNVDDGDRYPFLEREIDLIRAAVGRGQPVLGICLGSQLLAAALGGQVGRNPRGPEIGWHLVHPKPAAAADPLFRGLTTEEMLFHWHSDIASLPPGSVGLAASALTPNQAFRWGDRAYGIQFHFEVDAPDIDLWLSYREMRAKAAAVRALYPLLSDTHQYLPRLRQLREDIVGGFLDLLP